MIPIVSVLMPVYKTGIFLREAVDSILTQSFTDFELIILNDCSPDNAEEILDSYSDPRIVRYKGDKNVGLSNVLNIGIALARGKYIARMDSDDLSSPERLQIQVDYLNAHPKIDLVSVGMHLFGARNEVWIRDSDPEKVKIDAMFHSPVLHASSMWRKDRFEKEGLRFRQEFVPAEDYDLWTRALLKGLKLVNLPDVLYEYRIHPNQATSFSDKTSVQCRNVQQSFLQGALPTLSDKDRKAFPKRLWPVFLANLWPGFFDRLLLAKRIFKMSKARKS